MVHSGPPDDAVALQCQQCEADVQPSTNFCPHCGTAIGCPDCGTRFAENAAFCSQCGTERPTASDSQSQPDDGERYDEFRRRVESYTEAGWEITADHGDHVTVVDREIGSIGVHVLLLLFTSGFGNLLYGWYHYSKLATTRHLSVGGSTPGPEWTETAETTTESSIPATGIAYLTSFLIWVMSLTFLIGAVGTGSVGLGLLSLLFAAGGSYMLPPVQRRLDRRHRLTMFGRHKTVDRRVVHPHEAYEADCVVCGCSVGHGVLRRRRDETLVAGIPVRTHRLETNHYCTACVRDEQFVDSTGLTERPNPETEPAAKTTDN